MNRFGEKLRILRTQHGYSQRELADLLEVDQRHVSRMERGEKVPNAMMILKIANLFNVTADELMRDELELDE